MKTILVPTDFSPAARAATAVAETIALKQQAEVALLHIVEVPGSGSFNVEGEVLTTDNCEERIFSMKVLESAKQKLERLTAELTQCGVTTFNHYSEEEGIIHFAKNINADLIALSTHGRTGLAHVLAGSIAEDPANHSVIPVLTYLTKRSPKGERINRKTGSFPVQNSSWQPGDDYRFLN